VKALDKLLHNKLLVIIPFIIVFFFGCFASIAQTCRTPGGTGLILFEPCAYYPGEVKSEYCQIAAEHQGYEMVEHYLQDYPPGLYPEVTLDDFAEAMGYTDLGIFFISSHSSHRGVSVEFYEDTEAGELAVWQAWYEYTTTGEYGVDEIWVSCAEEHGYYVYVRPAGLERLCINLGETLVYAFGCHSSSLDAYWHALVHVGYWNRPHWSFIGDRFFWDSMDGILLNFQTKSGYSNHRKVSQAVKDIDGYYYPYGKYWLEFYGEGNVVLSPAVVSHQPWHLEQIGHNGYIEFDCELVTEGVEAEDVVMLTGVGLYGPELYGVHWALGSNHRIEFGIPDLPGFAWADFLVDPANVMSLYNEVHLDGNTIPPARNSMGPNTGPNGDFYNWTGKLYNHYLITFEDRGEDRERIGADIPSLIFHDFISTMHHYWWKYGETTENSNVYPYYVPNVPPYPTYPMFWVDGKFSAWIGRYEESPPPITARIEYIWGTASAVCFGYSCGNPTSFTILNADTHQIGGNVVSGNLIVEGWPERHSLGQIWLQSASQLITYLDVYSIQNTFGIDNMMVFDVLYGGLNYVPGGFNPTLQEIDAVQSGQDPPNFPIAVSDIVDSLYTMINWNEEDALEMGLDLQNPTGETVFSMQSEQSPIETPVIEDPMEGEWIAKVNAYPSPPVHDAYPFAIIAAVHCEPQVDCFFESQDDIKWYPDSPNLGDRVLISANVHCAGQVEEPIEYVRVRCYLGDPSQGVQIDMDEVAVDLEPGISDTVYFHFETEVCEGVDPCAVCVVIDPEDELEEYDEGNNIACKEITFGP
jgi:hypothetical protein